jgi:hypothetical protein
MRSFLYIMITAEYVRRRLQYDPETGVFIWKPRPIDKSWSTRYAGEVAGSIKNNGYRQIRIDGVKYGAARLAWLYVYGEWPENEIDHINRVRDDDRLVNLRAATRTENCNNRSSNNGLPEGVYWHTGNAKYEAWIPKGVPIFGNIYLGQYGDPIVAGEVVQEGINIICDNEDEETIRRLLKELKDSMNEILSEEQRDAFRASKKGSGLPKGVRKQGVKFAAQIWRNGKTVYLGTFDTPEEAFVVYQAKVNNVCKDTM